MLSPVWIPLVVATALATAWAVGRYFISSQAGNPQDGRAHQIDGLRGYLALSVFVTHAAATRMWFSTHQWDWNLSVFYQMAATVPVSLFFMITGFLFWGKAIKQNGRVPILPLLKSRLRRLAPLYLASVPVLLFIVGQRTSWSLNVDPVNLFKSIAQWSAIGAGGRPDINGLDKTWVIHTATWTLWYEWAFYAALPFIAFLRGIWGTIIVGFFLAGLCGYLGDEYVTLNFVAGALAAVLLERRPTSAFMQGHVMAIGCCLLLAVMALAHFQFYSPWHTLLLTPLFLCVCYGNSLFGMLSNAPARLLGAASFSIYILHCLVLQEIMFLVNLAHPLGEMSPIQYWSIVIGITVALVSISIATYSFIESPWMKRHGPDLTQPITV